MNNLDIIILILVLIPALIGFKKGFLKSIFSLASIILGFFLAVKFYSGFSLVVHKVISDEKTSSIVSFLSIIFLVYFAGIYIAGKLSKINKITRSLDKVLGLFLGIIKGMMLASIVILFIRTYNIISENNFRNSFTYPYVKEIAPETYKLISTLIPSGKKTFEDSTPFFKRDSTIKK